MLYNYKIEILVCIDILEQNRYAKINKHGLYTMIAYSAISLFFIVGMAQLLSEESMARQFWMDGPRFPGRGMRYRMGKKHRV